MFEQKPYTGTTRRLVLAFDIGTTFSDVSFCFLEPGKVPEIETQRVLKYPGQGETDRRVPSVMYYDSEGKLRAAGYEALQDDVIKVARTEGWMKVKWWKLLFRPKHLSSTHIEDDDIPPLPTGKSAIDVLSDFVQYLFKCTETFIHESYPKYIWQSVKDDIQFVFTHPNAWEGAQQKWIRRAIELAGLVPSTPGGRGRVRFLTEGEAGLYFCIWDSFGYSAPDQEKYLQGQGIVVIDAGGGIINLSMYSRLDTTTDFGEIAASECRLQGSVFVAQRAKKLLQKKLRGSCYDNPEALDDITNTFINQTTELSVSNAEHLAYIKLGNIHGDNPDRDVRVGKLRLPEQQVTQLFEDSINAVIDAFETQSTRAKIPITMAFLVGGFGTNDWFRSRLESYFKAKGIELSRPSRVHKAVSDGALWYFIDHLVKARIAGATYGTSFGRDVDQADLEHISRKGNWYVDANGMLRVRNAFQGIIYKGVQAHETKEFRHTLYLNRESIAGFGIEELPILCYRGTLPDPQWTDSDNEPFTTLCIIHCDLREVAKTLAPENKVSDQPGVYYSLGFDVILKFGSPEFSAQVAWQENGAERRSTAEMIYDDI